jgi:hypothetical protein
MDMAGKKLFIRLGTLVNGADTDKGFCIRLTKFFTLRFATNSKHKIRSSARYMFASKMPVPPPSSVSPLK